MRNFREYDIWIDSMNIVEEIYLLADSFPDKEKFGLSSQITRCAVSIPSNIAEGASRTSEKDFARFLEIALGSCFELETQLLISERRAYCSAEKIREIKEVLISIQKRIQGLIKKLKR